MSENQNNKALVLTEEDILPAWITWAVFRSLFDACDNAFFMASVVRHFKEVTKTQQDDDMDAIVEAFTSNEVLNQIFGAENIKFFTENTEELKRRFFEELDKIEEEN